MAYRKQAERDDYTDREETPVKERSEPLPEWFWGCTIIVVASVAIGGFAEGCTRTGYQGVFSGLIGAASFIGIAAMVRLLHKVG